MRHRRKGRKLNRTAAHRRAMFRNMVTSLVEHESIRTTEVKAKAVRPLAERMITLAKRGDLHARRQVLRVIRNREMVKKLFDVIAPRYVDRNGGYIRVIKLGERRGDGASMAVLQLMETVVPSAPKKSEEEGH